MECNAVQWSVMQCNVMYSMCVCVYVCMCECVNACMHVCLDVSMISHMEGEEVPDDVLHSLHVVAGRSLHVQRKYGAYMPNVPETELYKACHAWLKPLVEKIKRDLIALGRWDRHSVLSVYALGSCVCRGANRACSTRTLARASGDVGAFQLCCSVLGRTAMAIQAQPAQQQHRVGQRSSS